MIYEIAIQTVDPARRDEYIKVFSQTLEDANYAGSHGIKFWLMTDFCEKSFQQAKHRVCLRIVRRQLGYTLAVHQPMDRREAQPDATSLSQKTARNSGVFD